MRFNLTQILAFHAVARAGGFSAAAAARDGVSQPTLSAHVRALEAATGRKLFARAGRGVRLTAAGEELFAATQDLARAIDRIDDMLADERHRARRQLRIVTDSAIHVLPVLAELKRREPALRFSIRIANSEAAVAQLMADAADIAVAAHPAQDARLASRRLRDDRLVVIMPATDGQAGLGRIALAELAGRPIVLRERGSITRAIAEAALQAAGAPPGESLEVETREAALEAVAAGFGCGLVFASEAGEDPRLRRLDIDGTGVDVAEYVICRAERAGLPPVREFLAAAEKVAAERGWLKRA